MAGADVGNRVCVGRELVELGGVVALVPENIEVVNARRLSE